MPKVKVEKDNAERWLLTYADLMNLLLILFILLYSMANADTDRYRQVAASMRAAFGEASAAVVLGDSGGAPSMISLEATAPSSVVPSSLEEQQMQEVQETVKKLVSDLGLSNQVDVSLQERGIFISIGEQVLFKSGSADIEETSKENIAKIGREILAKIPGKQMSVEGHTDNVPISNSRFPDNQELSTARANSVLRVLVRDAGIDPTKLPATGYGEYRPKVPNDTEEHRKQNRRVDLVILRDIYDTSEPGAGDTASSSKTSTAQTSTAQTGTAQTSTAQTGTAQTSTAQTGTAQTSTAQTGTAQTSTAQTGTAKTQ
jgi:chemotaxis protein MotB